MARRKKNSLTRSNPNYDEPEFRTTGNGEPWCFTVDPPLPRGNRRKSTSTRRSVAPHRKQLVCLIADNSRSMKHNRKAEAVTQAVRELVYECRCVSEIASVFDLALFQYGSHIYGDESMMLRPVDEIVEDDFVCRGDGGQTKIKAAMEFVDYLLGIYDDEYLKLHDEPERVPPPLLILLSDGCNHDGNPRSIARKIRETPLSIGVPPILCTVGVEFGGEDLDKELLSDMASQTSNGIPLYFDITNASMLVEFLATTASSSAATPDEVVEQLVLKDVPLALPAPKEGQE